MTLFGITNYHWPICWIICFILFVRLSFSYLLWIRVIPYTWFRLRAHGGCDRSAEDAYSSQAPDPTFAFVGGPCWPTLDFVTASWIMIIFYTMLISLFCIMNLPFQSCYGFYQKKIERDERNIYTDPRVMRLFAIYYNRQWWTGC
jgi:hypothetical protein